MSVSALATAMAERCAIMIVYDHGWQQPIPRMITPHLMLAVHGVAYVIAYSHRSDAERTFPVGSHSGVLVGIADAAAVRH